MKPDVNVHIIIGLCSLNERIDCSTNYVIHCFVMSASG